MQLLDLELINFRNYEYEKLTFDPGLNLFYGKNAQGKTNLLESIYLAANARSFKPANDKELIRFNQRSAYIKALIKISSRKKEVEFKLSLNERKKIRINGLELDRIKDLREQFSLVLFAPEHLELVQGGPAGRREFMDSVLKVTNSLYTQALYTFKKILYQRNQLLKKRPRWFKDQLEVLDKQLAPSISYLVKNRRIFISEITDILKDIHRKLSEGNEEIDLEYRTNASEDPKENLLILKDSREEDINFQRTSIGPQRDDIEIIINGKTARNYASQGQSRTITLSCKLAEAALRRRKLAFSPILLLDDVFSELDKERSALLLDEIAEYQTIITTNSADHFNDRQDLGVKYLVKEGRIKRL